MCMNIILNISSFYLQTGQYIAPRKKSQKTRWRHRCVALKGQTHTEFEKLLYDRFFSSGYLAKAFGHKLHVPIYWGFVLHKLWLARP